MDCSELHGRERGRKKREAERNIKSGGQIDREENRGRGTTQENWARPAVWNSRIQSNNYSARSFHCGAKSCRAKFNSSWVKLLSSSWLAKRDGEKKREAKEKECLETRDRGGQKDIHKRMSLVIFFFLPQIGSSIVPCSLYSIYKALCSQCNADAAASDNGGRFPAWISVIFETKGVRFHTELNKSRLLLFKQWWMLLADMTAVRLYFITPTLTLKMI